jgi:hypothetical protein
MRSQLIVVAIVVALVVSGIGGYAVGRAQVRTEPMDPVILSGGDVGFRMVGRQGEKAVGVWVVRVEGKWVPIAAPWDVR